MYVYEFATGWWQARLKAYLYDIRNGTPEEAAAALKDGAAALARAERDFWSYFQMDDHAWDAAILHQFAIADVLYHTYPEVIPAAWKFTHPSSRNCLAEALECAAETGHEEGCLCNAYDAYYATYAPESTEEAEMLVRAVGILERYQRRYYCGECAASRARCTC